MRCVLGQGPAPGSASPAAPMSATTFHGPVPPRRRTVTYLTRCSPAFVMAAALPYVQPSVPSADTCAPRGFQRSFNSGGALRGSPSSAMAARIFSSPRRIAAPPGSIAPSSAPPSTQASTPRSPPPPSTRPPTSTPPPPPPSASTYPHPPPTL